jgi:hypothetical protein
MFALAVVNFEVSDDGGLAGASPSYPPAIRLRIKHRPARPILQLEALDATAIYPRIRVEPGCDLDARAGVTDARRIDLSWFVLCTRRRCDRRAENCKTCDQNE